MAPSRAISFPSGYVDQILSIPPFSVPETESEILRSCHAFQAIRGFLKNQRGDDFCTEHQPLTASHEEAWLLQRDITYALILPILEIYRYAEKLATSVLGERNIFDLELVFRGEARGAFSWLQCFITEEDQWCKTHGCPACVVAHVLEAEPSMRIVLTACRLAQSLRRASHAPNTLPIFDFWLSSLRAGLDKDPFWGPAFWKDLEPRASSLENGIYHMVRQCIEFESMGQSGPGTLTSDDNSGVRTNCVGSPMQVTKIIVRKAEGQKILSVSEEATRMHIIILGCWTSLLADAGNVDRKDRSYMADIPPRSSRSVSY